MYRGKRWGRERREERMREDNFLLRLLSQYGFKKWVKEVERGGGRETISER